MDATRVFTLDLRRDGGRWAGRVELLDADEASRRERFLAPVDRDRYTAAHVGLRLLLARCLGRPGAPLRFGRRPCSRCGGAHGKPYLLGDHGLEWSMAHSGDLVLYAVSDAPVGIDVERTVGAAEADALSGVLHPLERQALAALPAAERALAFSQCWTRKEALLKGLGVGLNESLGDRFVGLGSRHAQAPSRISGWWLSDLLAAPGYVAALAVAGRLEPPRRPVRFDPVVVPE